MPCRIFCWHVAEDTRRIRRRVVDVLACPVRAYEGTVLQTGTLPVCTRPGIGAESPAPGKYTVYFGIFLKLLFLNFKTIFVVDEM